MLNRRQMLGASIGGFYAFAARHQRDQIFARQPLGLAKRCIVLWMDGGPSQLDTFDPKPKTATGGTFRSIATAADGVQICETLPKLAERMQHLSVIRNLSSNEGEHGRAQYYLRTGHELIPSFPRPALGSMVSYESPAQDFPNYVSIGSPGIGPAYLGPDHAPFSIENADTAVELLRQTRNWQSQIELMRELDQTFSAGHEDLRLRRRQAMLHKIERMLGTNFMNALDLARSTSADRQRYGNSRFGQNCLVARRLLESGVSFVEIQQGGWDTHQNNFDAVARLCGEIDGPWSVLLDDLQSSGMLSETLIVWMGEFGRTPTINGQNGRDHFPQVTPVVLGGGPIRGGLAIGETNRDGTQIVGDSYRVADLFATMLSAFGIPADKEYTTSFDSPTQATDGGRVIEDLLS